MERNLTEVIYGSGSGKTAMAVGKCLRASLQGKSVIVIHFLKGSERGETDILEELKDFDIKTFRFEKQEAFYQELSDQEKEEERVNIQNGLNFARKVIATRECDFLVLDELLGVIDMGIALKETIMDVLSARDGSMEIIMTGTNMPGWMAELVDQVTRVTTEVLTEA